MLIEISVKNYRSFRDETILSLEATKSSTLKSVLIPFGEMQILPSAAIYGKNGGGKSNVIRAFWLAVQFIRNAQRTQHEKAPIPVTPFALNDYSASEPTKFSSYIRWMESDTGIRFQPQREKCIPSHCIMRQKEEKRWFLPERDKNFRSQKRKPAEN